MKIRVLMKRIGSFRSLPAPGQFDSLKMAFPPEIPPVSGRKPPARTSLCRGRENLRGTDLKASRRPQKDVGSFLMRWWPPRQGGRGGLSSSSDGLIHLTLFISAFLMAAVFFLPLIQCFC